MFLIRNMDSHLRRMKHSFETPKTTQNSKGILLQPEIIKDCDRYIAFPQGTSQKGGESNIFFKVGTISTTMKGPEKSDLSQASAYSCTHCPWPTRKVEVKPSPVFSSGGRAFSAWSAQRGALSDWSVQTNDSV